MTEKPEKQRKKQAQADLHEKQKKMASMLSKELREDYEKRRIPVRAGDKVEVMRGDAKGETGEVSEVDLTREKVTVEGVIVEKPDGSEVPKPLDPSNLKIIDLDTSDRERIKLLGR
ncbi:MAG: Ribosomal protein L24 [Candidatus Methanohalarchaeum thermophilum]|uniref:Large ribosomal subunit protein uL24 n=1 Tax=Methanohalarchaeum thermophilum TaxID=1903181 RepID=A0A1Q6DX14_METT1|nr:MAG: Ribosomal protein L24 [Candidatus Methanohalarchaeum thermophilum]